MLVLNLQRTNLDALLRHQKLRAITAYSVIALRQEVQGALFAIMRFVPFTVLRISMAIVMGPTPPGTGVIMEATAAHDS